MFANFGAYFKFICRRERVSSVMWLASCVCAFVGIAAYYPRLLPDEASLTSMVTMMDTPAMVAMMGPVYGAEAYTPAIAMASECLVWYLLVIAIMNVFLINRHTRADEEQGRLEMLVALPVGRLTGSFAALVFAFAMNAVISVLTALGLTFLNIGGVSAAGAFVFSFAIGMTGFLFAGLTLLLAQLFTAKAAVSGAGMAALGLFYILRASGDVAGNALSYLSPLGLASKAEAFYANNTLPLIILFAVGVILSVAALGINAVRDLGTGIIPARKGKAHAGGFLRSPLGLAWRLTRQTALWWAAALFVVGAMYGSVAGDIDGYAKDNELVSKMLEAAGGGTMTEQYIAMLFQIMSVICAVPAALSVLRLRNEETRGRLEQVFGRSVKRSRFILSFALISFTESFIMLLITALGLAAASGGGIAYGTAVGAAFAYLPALWVMTGLTAALTGALPRLAPLVWALLGYSFVTVFFGKLIDLPGWTAKVSPFGNVPQLPIQEFSLAPLCALTAIAALLAGMGVWRYRERDIG